VTQLKNGLQLVSVSLSCNAEVLFITSERDNLYVKKIIIFNTMNDSSLNRIVKAIISKTHLVLTIVLAKNKSKKSQHYTNEKWYEDITYNYIQTFIENRSHTHTHMYIYRDRHSFKPLFWTFFYAFCTLSYVDHFTSMSTRVQEWHWSLQSISERGLDYLVNFFH